MEILIPILAAGVVFLLVLALLFSRGGETAELRGLMRRMSAPAQGGDLDVNITKKRRPEEGQLLQVFYRMNMLRKLEQTMWQAGIYSRVGDILLIILLLFGAGMFGARLFSDSALISLGAGALLGSIPLMYIRFRKGRRLKAFGLQLPFCLDLIKSSLEAGHSLQRALQVVVGEFGDPLGGEFRTVLEQNRIGLPLGRAMDDLVKRVPEDDLRLFVVAVRVQTEVGSSLALMIGRLCEIVRTRQRLRLQINALTAQARFGGMIVGLLPVIVLLIFNVIQPGYTDALFYNPLGQKILKAAIFGDLLALVTIRRLVRVNY
ncbi:MAG TPA: type II secretion system F family protein [Candidatus Binataceae bacterium]|nr:type II secretion system F family protein [Candidatus Binataceae bacterium]